MDKKVNNGGGMKLVSVLLILMSGIIWGCTGPYVRVFSEFGLESKEIAAIRCLISAAGMGGGLLFFKKRDLKIKLKDWWVFAGTGILSVTFYYCCYFATILLTSLSVAAVLLYTSPVFVMILSALFLGEKINTQKLAALILTLSGSVCASGLLTGNAVISLAGLGVGLCSGFGYALYSIFSRVALNRGYSSFTITFYTMLLAGVSLYLLSDGNHMMRCLDGLSGFNIISMIAASLVITLIPFLCYTVGLKHIETGKAAVIVAVEPVAAAILGVVFYHEQMTPAVFGGLVLVLAGIIVLNLNIFNEGRS